MAVQSGETAWHLTPTPPQISKDELEGSLIAMRIEQQQGESQLARSTALIRSLKDRNDALEEGLKAQLNDSTSHVAREVTKLQDEKEDLRKQVEKLQNKLADLNSQQSVTAAAESMKEPDIDLFMQFNQNRTRTFIAVYHYRPSPPVVVQIRGIYYRSIHVREGDIVSVEGDLRKDGLYVCKANGIRGVIPAAFLEPLHDFKSMNIHRYNA